MRDPPSFLKPKKKMPEADVISRKCKLAAYEASLTRSTVGANARRLKDQAASASSASASNVGSGGSSSQPAEPGPAAPAPDVAQALPTGARAAEGGSQPAVT